MIAGAGPTAGAFVHHLLVQACQQLGARDDSDFPELIVLSAPLELTATGFADDRAGAVAQAVNRSAQRLQDAGATVLLPACNTISLQHDRVSLRRGARLVNLPELAAAAAGGRRLRRVAVLASATSRRLGLFDSHLAMVGCGAVHTSQAEQAVVDDLIAAVMAGHHTDEHRARMADLADAVARRAAQAVIVGCTELSVLAPAGPSLIDTAHLGAAHAARLSMKES